MTRNILLVMTGVAVMVFTLLLGIGLGLTRAERPGVPVSTTLEGSTINLVDLINEPDHAHDVFTVLIP